MIRLIIIFLLTANIAYGEDENSANLEQRINELTDKVEQLTHQNNILQKKLESLGSDIEYRFKEIEQGKVTKAAVANEEPEKPVVKLGDPKNAKIEFDKAYAFLKTQKYAEAEEALSLFVKAYPNSEYTGNAYYWLGESFALRKKYDKAAINYIISFNKFPKNNKADLSMIKLTSALNSLGKKKEACATLAKVKAKKDSLNPAMQKILQREVSKMNCK